MNQQQSRRRHIDWSVWVPDDVAMLLFVRRDDGCCDPQLARCRQDRGLGGRLEPGETSLQAAVANDRGRASSRSTCTLTSCVSSSSTATPCTATPVADGHRGEPAATDEALPMWVRVGAPLFMWADDELRLPHVLAGCSIDGRFVFDGENDVDLSVEGPPVAPGRPSWRRERLSAEPSGGVRCRARGPRTLHDVYVVGRCRRQPNLLRRAFALDLPRCASSSTPARSTRSSRSPTCRVACRAHATHGTSSTTCSGIRRRVQLPLTVDEMNRNRRRRDDVVGRATRLRAAPRSATLRRLPWLEATAMVR